MLRARTISLTLALFFLAACGPPGWERPDASTRTTDAGSTLDPCLPAGHVPFAELGTGVHSPEPLAEDQGVPYEAGPQGGHHVWVSVRALGVHQAGTLSTFTAQLEDASGVLVTRTVPFVLKQDADGACTLSGMRLQLDENPSVDVTTLVGQRVVLRVHMVDADGRELRDERRIILQAPIMEPSPPP